MSFERASGVLLHPTSFPSKFGIGDLGKAAYDFVDFLEQAGQKLWQILPLSPTSFGDSPYQSFSTFACNHMLISPDTLVEKGYLEQCDIEMTPEFENTKIDYGKVINYKNGLFKKAYTNFKSSKEFDEYCEKNKWWLDDYALFVSLKDYFINERVAKGYTKEFDDFEKKIEKYMKGNLVKDYYFGAVWSTWPQELVRRDKKAVEKWTDKLKDSIRYTKFLQFEFECQWQKLKAYANEKKIQIIGDIPIFVAFDSADTWANSELFYLDATGYPTEVAGVPPDYFSETGQLWGNPLYNWANHKATNYKWWIERIKSVLTLVDIVRIDHFRGFQAFWAVPFGMPNAIVGKWRKGPNEDLFNAIESELGELPIIAEDLGLITPEVETLRDKFNLPGMKVLQFCFGNGAGDSYLPHNYVQNCVVYSGTHDNNTTLGWYNNDASEVEQDYFRRYMNVSGENASWDLIRLAFASCAVFAIVPMQDLLCLGSEARMNTPGVTGTSWMWRYEEEVLTEGLADRLKYLTKIFGRNFVISAEPEQIIIEE